MWVGRLVWRVTAVLGPPIDWPISFQNTVQNGSLRKPAAARAILAARGRQIYGKLTTFFGLKLQLMSSAALANKKNRGFDPHTFLATIGEGRKMLAVPKHQTIYTQGDEADAVFYVQKGRVKLTVVSKIGKEATIGILSEGNFFGEGSLAGQVLRMGSAAAMTDCELLRVEKQAMMDALHREHAFSDMFVAYLLARNIRYEEDLVDQLFNSSERDWPVCFLCSLILARRACRKRWSQESVRRR